MTTKYVSLDVWQPNAVCVCIMQGETQTRALRISVLDQGNVYDLSNKSVQFCMVKPDDTLIYNDARIVDAQNGLVEVDFSLQMCAVSGEAKRCELHIVDANAGEIKISGINVYIKESINTQTVESSDEFTALQTALAKCQQVVFEQDTPSGSWYINHNLDKYPKITLVDENGVVVNADICYVDADNVLISVNPACSGKAIIN